MSQVPRILIVDDDESILESVSFALEQEGYQVLRASDGQEALLHIQQGIPDMAVLDVMLPDRSGLELCRYLRILGEIPILFLSARDALEDKVQGFESGADDYLVKPFKFKELVVRVRALLRRRKAVESHLEYGDLRLEPSTRNFTRSGEPLQLTLREHELLEFLLRRPRHVFSREELLQQLWGYPEATETNVLEVHISSLRAKLKDTQKQIIRTVRGVGYSLG